MGFTEWLSRVFGRRAAPDTFAPQVIVVGNGPRSSGFVAGELPRITADGVRVDPQTLRYLRYMAVMDEDLYGAVRDLQVLANPGYDFEVESGSKRAIKAAERALEGLDDLVDQKGFTGFINNQIFEVATTGASSVEWVPTRRRDDLQQAVVVPTETIAIFRGRDGKLIYRQQIGGEQITLNPTTYLYAPLQTAGDSPYGIPLIIAALRGIDRKGKMIESVDRMIKLLGLAGIVQASVRVGRPQDYGYETEADPGYIDHVTTMLKKVADLLTEGEEKGVFVVPEGTDVNVVSAARDISSAYTAWTDNEHLIWSGSRTLPFMRGRSESLSETWAKVAYPIILAEAHNVQRVVARQINFGVNLMLRLQGIPAKARVKFSQPASPFNESDARAKFNHARADQILVELLGDSYREQVYRSHGLRPPEAGGGR